MGFGPVNISVLICGLARSSEAVVQPPGTRTFQLSDVDGLWIGLSDCGGHHSLAGHLLYDDLLSRNASQYRCLHFKLPSYTWVGIAIDSLPRNGSLPNEPW